ncbi:hypothetical protein NKH71_31710 [Mesorhizobium sp. M0983]|uniref:hypothetical protein n=1 Tax=Mesorhizobium sp. M0983 TaxID=2957040 RepID=UPI0033395A19
MSVVLERICVELAKRRPHIIAVDGYLGAGKTTVSVEIAARLNYSCLHIDDFLRPHEGSFLPSLRYECLESGMMKSHVVIEGVCVLAVLRRLNLASDVLIYVRGRTPRVSTRDGSILDEVDRYTRTFNPEQKADYVIDTPQDHTSWRLQVDIAYINAKTRLAMLLAGGGILAILIGAVVFVIGATGEDTTTIKIAGFEISATGLGAVILATSAIWGYLAFLARPKYSHSRQYRNSSSADGSSNIEEIESSTVVKSRPQ